MSLKLLLGKTDASLQIRKLWWFVPDLCRHPLLRKPCTSLLFLLGGYNDKNLNMVRVLPCMSARELDPQSAPLGNIQQCLLAL